MKTTNQQEFIRYISAFARDNKIHIWLGGSFLKGIATLYSDVDISILGRSDLIKKLIYGYGKPVFISRTSKPAGILIVIYEDGVSVDIEIVESISILGTEYFHSEDIKLHEYRRDEKLYREFVLRDDIPYQISRLFHRSLIKYLSGREEIGISIANEIVTFLNFPDHLNSANYRTGIGHLLDRFSKLYAFETEYERILRNLIDFFG